MKAMYRHGDEEQRLTAISPNHLDVRDTVSAEWLHHQTNTHAYTHICVCPPGPCGEVECISLLCSGRRGCWRGGGVRGCDVGEGREGGREVAVVRKYAQHTRSVRCCCHDRGHQPACPASLSHTHAYTRAHTHTQLHTRTQVQWRLSTTCLKHASAFKGSSPPHTHKNAHLQKQTQHASQQTHLPLCEFKALCTGNNSSALLSSHALT